MFCPCSLGVIIIAGEAGLSVLLKKFVMVLFDNSHLKTHTSQSDPLKMFEALLQNPSVHLQEENCIQKKHAMTTAGVFDSQPCTVEMTENKGKVFTLLTLPLI